LDGGCGDLEDLLTPAQDSAVLAPRGEAPPGPIGQCPPHQGHGIVPVEITGRQARQKGEWRDGSTMIRVTTNREIEGEAGFRSDALQMSIEPARLTDMRRIEGADRREVRLLRLEHRHAQIELQENPVSIAMADDAIGRGAVKHPEAIDHHPFRRQGTLNGLARSIAPDGADVARSGSEPAGKHRDVEAVSSREHAALCHVAIDHVVPDGNDANHVHTSC
jgi:hypothetical protein